MYRVILFPLYLLSLLPMSILYKFADFLAFLMRKVFHYRESVISTNLSRSFPELKYDEIKQITKDYYTYLADVLVESLWCISASQKEITERIKITNPEVLSDIYNRYRKAVVVMGHVGNWEMMGSGLCQEIEGKDTSYREAGYIILYKKMKSERMTKIIEGYRRNMYRKMGNPGRILDSHSAINYMEKHENESNLYFFIADQSGKNTSRFVVDFLNQPSLLIAGPEILARNFDMPVVYLGMNRYKRGQYSITFTAICEKSRQTKKGYISGIYAALLEKDIKSNKACWLWSHKRWKTDISAITHKLYYIKRPNEEIPETARKKTRFYEIKSPEFIS